MWSLSSGIARLKTGLNLHSRPHIRGCPVVTSAGGLLHIRWCNAETQRRLSNVKVQRLRQLETSNPGISELVRWLDVPENKSRFRGQVFGPILCEISVDNPQNAAYLEQHCPSESLGGSAPLALNPKP